MNNFVIQTWCVSSLFLQFYCGSEKPEAFRHRRRKWTCGKFCLRFTHSWKKTFPLLFRQTSSLLCLVSVKPEKNMKLLLSGHWISSQTTGWKLVSQDMLDNNSSKLCQRTYYSNIFDFFLPACGSFSGSFIEYFSHDMSKFCLTLLLNKKKTKKTLRLYINLEEKLTSTCSRAWFLKRLIWVLTGFPVRRKYPQSAADRLNITSDETIVFSDDSMEDSVVKPQEEVSRCSKRLLPDRSQAAYNRANEKLVQFIVKQRKADKHLLVRMHSCTFNLTYFN